MPECAPIVKLNHPILNYTFYYRLQKEKLTKMIRRYHRTIFIRLYIATNELKGTKTNHFLYSELQKTAFCLLPDRVNEIYLQCGTRALLRLHHVRQGYQEDGEPCTYMEENECSVDQPQALLDRCTDSDS